MFVEQIFNTNVSQITVLHATILSCLYVVKMHESVIGGQYKNINNINIEVQ